jgi:hypothetical protein
MKEIKMIIGNFEYSIPENESINSLELNKMDDESYGNYINKVEKFAKRLVGKTISNKEFANLENKNWQR